MGARGSGSARIGTHHALRGRQTGAYLYQAPTGWRRKDSDVRRAGRRTIERRLHRTAGGESSDRISQSRTPQSRGMHGQESEELQRVLREGGQLAVQVLATLL